MNHNSKPILAVLAKDNMHMILKFHQNLIDVAWMKYKNRIIYNSYLQLELSTKYLNSVNVGKL